MAAMTEFSGTGDPARSLALLWRASAPSPRGRGPRPGLTVDQVVEAAIGVADREGLGALSMRRVAAELGVGTTSLYTYVPGKPELLDVMIDTVAGEALPPDDAGGRWRERLAAVARDNWALFRRHPWLLQVATGRPPLGPHITEKYERELRAVDGIGLTDVEMDAVLGLVIGHAETAARRAVEAAQVRERSGQTDAQWWAANAPLLGRVLDAGRFPTASRVGTAAGEAFGAASDPEHAFAFGLERVLDGVAALLAARGEPTGDPG
jgi:AcrR family transcriptional regulator